MSLAGVSGLGLCSRMDMCLAIEDSRKGQRKRHEDLRERGWEGTKQGTRINVKIYHIF
jgi:hypothetical protein